MSKLAPSIIVTKCIARAYFNTVGINLSVFNTSIITLLPAFWRSWTSAQSEMFAKIVLHRQLPLAPRSRFRYQASFPVDRTGVGGFRAMRPRNPVRYRCQVPPAMQSSRNFVAGAVASY